MFNYSKLLIVFANMYGLFVLKNETSILFEQCNKIFSFTQTEY